MTRHYDEKIVYFIKPIGFDGPIKIGCSCNPSQRREQLELWSPFPLEVMASLSGGLALERRFHNKYRDQHRNHEWFTVTPELLSDIASIVAGTFDIETLPAAVSLHKGKGRPTGAIWTPERRALHARRMSLRRAERTSGFVFDRWHTDENIAAFIANPGVETGGVPVKVYHRRINKRRVANGLPPLPTPATSPRRDRGDAR